MAKAEISWKRRGLPWIGDRCTWTTQLNVRNVLGHSRVWVVPTSSNGTVLNARLSAQPREFVWTNTLDFRRVRKRGRRSVAAAGSRAR